MALRQPLQYVSGPPGGEIFLALRNQGGSGLINHHDRLFLQFRNGRLAGGSQVIHLVPHKGRLYAANGYWLDNHNVWYGGTSQNIGWGQVLRLAAPSEPWSIDFELGPRYLRTGISI